MLAFGGRDTSHLDIPLRFMALSLASLVIAIVAFQFIGDLVAGGFSDLRLIAMVHALTLGCIGSMLIGASYQLVPVAMQVSLPWPWLARLSFSLWTPGIVLFIVGAYQQRTAWMAIGVSLVGLAVTMYVGIVVRAWRASPKITSVLWHLPIAAGLGWAGLVMGVLLGISRWNGVLGGHTLVILAVHMILMILGWVLLTLIGVSYVLVGMFTLSERHIDRRRVAAELLAMLASIGLLVTSFILETSSLRIMGAVVMIVGLSLWIVQLGIMYRRRMRKTIDVHMPFMIASATVILVATIMTLVGFGRGLSPSDAWWKATIWLVLTAGVLTAIFGFFHKIATFLVWLKVYAPIAGRCTVPTLEQMYSRHLAGVCLGCWLAGSVMASVSMLTSRSLWHPAILVMNVGIVVAGINIWSIFRHWFLGETT